ncbi:hypothetical protein [Bosea sp. UNC402CLCol]|uniref:hypothetical protein n=1 Tax=unclassified Bosea (in: a-proteobacteria) TaxID=2653178 RepID=UPI000ACD8E71|nr:hypothetical protein [Bosea sp. UNC402CLCol]
MATSIVERMANLGPSFDADASAAPPPRLPLGVSLQRAGAAQDAAPRNAFAGKPVNRLLDTLFAGAALFRLGMRR